MYFAAQIEQKRFLNHLLKALNHKISIEISQFIFILYQILNLTMLKLNLCKIQQTINDSPASAQS